MSSLPVSYLARLRSGSVTIPDIVTKGCLHPSRVAFKSSCSPTQSVQYFDCGCCLNCINERRNQWVSRMCLHSLYHKYCYFVTLTYGSYDLTKFEEHPFRADWLETAPSLDSDNIYNAPRWTPSLLISSHLQKFLKRLRILLGDSHISFAACGEYGSTHGRPHFHVILWSDTPIIREHIAAAWSVMCVRTGNPRVIKPYRSRKTPKERVFPFRIGRIDFNDLVNNGSLDWNSDRPTGDNSNARKCFNYVAKYLFKDTIKTIPHSAMQRLQRVFPLLPCSSDESIDMDSSEASIYKQYYLNSTSHEKVCFAEFVTHVSPFFRTSRKYSLGKDYYLENRSRFQSGNYALPKFCGRELSFPNYYYRLLSLEEQPLRLVKVVSSGVSFSKGDYQSLIYYFEKLSIDRSSFFDIYNLLRIQKPTTYHRAKFFSTSDPRPRWYDDYTDATQCGNLLECIILSSTDTPFYVKYSYSSDSFDFYVYDKESREYVFHHYEERTDFCTFVIENLRRQIQNYNKQKSVLSAKYELDYLVKGKLLGESVNMDDPDDVSEYEKLQKILSVYLERKHIRDVKYNSTHYTKDLL